MNYIREQILKTIDLAVLHPTASWQEVENACAVVESVGMASVCVAPIHVAFAKRFTDRVCSVIGFPHGNTTREVKLAEAASVMRRGAIELDVVINYGMFLQGEKWALEIELRDIIEQAHKHGAKVKAILETCYYSPAQITDACRLCVGCGVDWVKTSTGFGSLGATPAVVTTMLYAVAGRAQVKASGGIKTYADACRYLYLGCTRLGVSVANYLKVLP